MGRGQEFIDYYAVLQVDPHCDPKILETAYHHLAKTYHPDHAEEADTAKFSKVIEAYKVLRNPEKRTEYDVLYASYNKEGWATASSSLGVEVNEEDALNDADDHFRILMYLYKKRREQAQSADVVGFYLQEMLNCTDEHFEFHKWYLKEKGYIAMTEHGTLAITVQGIDHVITMSRTVRAEKLLIAQSSELRNGPPPDLDG